MKKLITTLLLLCSLSFAADVRVAGSASYGTLGRGLTWTIGLGTTNFIMDAISPSSGICLTIINNDTNAHNFNLAAYQTSDLSLVTFSTAKWTQLSVSPPLNGAATYSVAASSNSQFYVRTPGAAHITFSFSGVTGATGTADLMYAQTPISCGSVPAWSGATAVNGAFAANGLGVTIPAVPGVKHVVNCVSVGEAQSAATADEKTFDIVDGGTNLACPGTGTIVWNTITGVTNVIGAASNVSVCGLNIPSGAGNTLRLCAEGTGTAGAFYRISFSGYDSQ